MSFYDDDDVMSWGDIDQDDTSLDAMARLYIFDTVSKNIDIAETNSEDVPDTFSQWQDVLEEEIAWDSRQGDWLTDDIFDAFCGRVDALLPYFLENYEPIQEQIRWD